MIDLRLLYQPRHPFRVGEIDAPRGDRRGDLLKLQHPAELSRARISGGYQSRPAIAWREGRSRREDQMPVCGSRQVRGNLQAHASNATGDQIRSTMPKRNGA